MSNRRGWARGEGLYSLVEARKVQTSWEGCEVEMIGRWPGTGGIGVGKGLGTCRERVGNGYGGDVEEM